MPNSLKSNIETLREMFALAANERRMKEADAINAAIESLSRQGGDSKVGAMDLSAPPRVWLQIDTNGDDECRDEPILESNWGDLTWCYESIGGQEVVYIRQDLAPTRASEAGGWVLVPTECTHIMEYTLSEALDSGDYSIGECLNRAIAAAPAPGGDA